MDKQTSAPPISSDEQSESPLEETPANEAVVKPQKPRFVKVLRFIVAPTLVVLAVICGIFAWLTATVWRPDPTARAVASAQSRYIATDPGVLPLGNEQVSISVDSSQKVCLAIGSAQDVAGWIASNDYTRVEGLTSWSELTTSTAQAAEDSATSEGADAQTDADADADAESTLALEDSDMWLTAKCGTGTLTANWKATDANQALIVDTNPDAAESETAGNPVTLALTWVRTSVLDLSTPLIFLAVLLVIAAALCATVFSLVPARRRKQRAARVVSTTGAAGETSAADAEATQVIAGIGTGAGGLDSPRWVHDHIESEHRRSRTSHRKDTSHKGSRTAFFAKKGRRDGSHAEENGVENAALTPAIVDVKNVNMVARQQEEQHSSSASHDAMAEYFARLAQERLGSEESAPSSAIGNGTHAAGTYSSAHTSQRTSTHAGTHHTHTRSHSKEGGDND